MYTGSLGLYKGNYYFYLRPFFTPNDAGVSTSGTINIRKYKSDADNYFEGSFGLGFSPESDRFDVNLNNDIIIKLNSQKANLGYYFTSKSKKHAWGTKLGIAHQEKINGDYIWIYSFGINYDVRFR